jgi:MATE family multidrug resistance protein
VTSGILRGLGKTIHASVGGFIGYWVIALPLEYLFAIHLEYGVLGLWYGLMFGSIFHALF